jgi:hypothetical protein
MIASEARKRQEKLLFYRFQKEHGPARGLTGCIVSRTVSFIEATQL